jgi:hypothetical protein
MVIGRRQLCGIGVERDYKIGARTLRLGIGRIAAGHFARHGRRIQALRLEVGRELFDRDPHVADVAGFAKLRHVALKPLGQPLPELGVCRVLAERLEDGLILLRRAHPLSIRDELRAGADTTDERRTLCGAHRNVGKPLADLLGRQALELARRHASRDLTPQDRRRLLRDLGRDLRAHSRRVACRSPLQRIAEGRLL